MSENVEKREPSGSRKLSYPTWADVRAADKISREHAEKGRRDRDGIYYVNNGSGRDIR